jgi:hypothetical protein
LNDLSAQADADLGLSRPETTALLATRRVTIDLDHADFWTALDKIGDLTDIRPQKYNGQSRISLGTGGPDLTFPQSVLSGAFLIAPQAITYLVTFGRGGPFSELSSELSVMAEPKVHVVGDPQGWLTECVDEKGNSLLTSIGTGPIFCPDQSHWWWDLRANLQLPANIGSKIARMKGKLKFTVQTASDVFVLKNLMQAQNVAKTIGDMTLTVQQCGLDDKGYELRVKVCDTKPDKAKNDPWWEKQDLAGIEVLDAADQPLARQNYTYNSSDQQNFAALLWYTSKTTGAGPTGPPQKLRWEAPTQTENRTVLFELDNLDLPSLH